MSGGHYDYAYHIVDDMADALSNRRGNSLLRDAFVMHLRLVSAAMHEVEWADSGDGATDEDSAIRACLGPFADEAVLLIARERAAVALEELIRVLGAQSGNADGNECTDVPSSDR